MEQITSLQNEYIKKLCKLSSVSGRRENGLFLVEGYKLCAEAINSGWDIESVLYTERTAMQLPLDSYTCRTIQITDHIAKKLSSMDTPPGIFAVVRQRELPPEKPTFILALDHISDPANLGAILRSAEAFGTDLIFLSEGCVDLFSPKVLRATMGSIFRASVQRGNLATFLMQQKEKGFCVFGAGLDKNFKKLPDVSFDIPSVVVIGNEANGISTQIMELCDQGLFIPMLGKNESLNAAVAASIILWERSKWK